MKKRVDWTPIIIILLILLICIVTVYFYQKHQVEMEQARLEYKIRADKLAMDKQIEEKKLELERQKLELEKQKIDDLRVISEHLQDKSDESKETRYVVNVECAEDRYSCTDFSSQSQAQRFYDACGGVSNDVHRIDKDKDGIPCEGLK